MKLSVVIPCYNEAQNIPLIVARLGQVMGERQDIEMILVENGSTDGSADVMRRELAKAGDSRLKMHCVPINRGYGYGILSGLKAVSGEVLGWTHADMQTDPADVLAAFDLYRKQTELHPGKKILVKGRRKNRALLENFFTFGMQCVASAALGVKLDDINAQPKIFDRYFFELLIRHDAPLDFSLDLFLLCQAVKAGYTILNVPVFFAKRLHGEAKGGGSFRTRIKLMHRTFAYICKLRQQMAS